MFSVVIEEKAGGTTVKDFQSDEVTIGRVQGNDIILPKSNISKRHARIINKGDSFVVIDSKSTNGTYINGQRIDAPFDVSIEDKIYIGDFTLQIKAPETSQTNDEISEDEIFEEPTQAELPEVEEAPDEPTSQSNDELWEEDGSGEDDFDNEISDDDWGDSWEIEDSPEDSKQVEVIADEPATEDNEEEDFEDLEDVPHLGEEDEAVPHPPTMPMQAHKNTEDVDGDDFEDDLTGDLDDLSEPEIATEAEPEIAAEAEPETETLPQEHTSLSTEHSQALASVHERLLRSLDLRRLNLEEMNDAELRERTQAAVQEIVQAMAAEEELPEGVDPEHLVESVLDEALGLGPLESLLQDESINEIMVNGAKQIYVERAGKIEVLEREFSSDQAVLSVIERILAPLGRRINESSPMVDARLKDGSRVNAIIPPLALNGPVLTIRKFTRKPLAIDDLIGKESLTHNMGSFLQTCVRARKNIVISGGTGSGKTTTLNVFSNFIPEDERIITIEDAAELKLNQEHLVSLESRPPNVEDKGEINIRDLVRNALRMRPDRIIVGECRGGEALDMLQAMNTGHDGSLTTVHANGPRDVLSRLETMVLMSGMDLPLRAIRDQIAGALDIIVQQTRFPDGSRRITHISEVTGMEGDVISMQDIFVFEQDGIGEDGKISGHFKPTGVIPRFFEQIGAMGIKADFTIFQDEG